MINVLYLDDESHNLTAFRAAFRRDFHVHVTTEPTEAVRILREQPIEVIISDQKMPSLSGVEFFELIMPDYPDPIRMLLTGHADIDAVIDAINKGQIYKYISKPWNEVELKSLVEEAAALFHERKVMANEGQELITKMDEARLLARRIHLLATNAGGIDMDVQAEIAKLANQIDRLLHS
jgi:response regulator RpfG family c-di-GMP phosphodiesterase